jgi:hypothetical protein
MRKNFKNTKVDFSDEMRRKCLEKIQEHKNNKLEMLRMSDLIRNVYQNDSIEISDHEIDILERDIVQYLEEEEIRAHMEEYERNLAFEENIIEGILERNEMFEKIDDKFVICPCCKKNRLLCTNNTFFCACGLRIPCHFEGISMKLVQQNVVDAYYEHK